MSLWPFRFYGAAPDDRFDGLQDYELRFVRSPTPDERLRLAHAFEGALADEPSVKSADIWPREGWWWSEHWALCPVKRASDAGFDEAMQRALRAIDEVVPLEEVVNLTARTRGGDPWSDWSLGLRPPNAGPKWEDGVDYAAAAYGHARIRWRERPYVSDAFEAE